MGFTDDDLDRFKEELKIQKDGLLVTAPELKALLARLEAAEAYGMACPAPYGANLIRLYEVWRKSRAKP